MDVVSSLRRYIAENFLHRRGVSQVGEDDPLLESGIVDSMGILQLVGFLESRFGIDVDDEDIVPENFETMMSISAFVDMKVRQKGS